MKTSRPTAARSYPTEQGLSTERRHGPVAVDGRWRVDVYRTVSHTAALRRDVYEGLRAPHKTLPPKYFYDDRGARLLDAICDLPEYYLTRSEEALLRDVIDEIVMLARPSDVVEFGSGASRKTRIVLDALARGGRPLTYIPMDVSEGMLRRSSQMLLGAYPRLRVRAVVGDYEHDLRRLPRGRRRLVLFLGSTIGNFRPAAAGAFLSAVRGQLVAGEHFLLGVDLVKSVDVLEAAYNDRAGVTAEFNRNILRVINRHLDADFEPERFEHLAFFNAAQSQIEMHLRAAEAHAVSVRALRLDVPFVAGETIHTEISRKFTRDEVEALLSTAGFEPLRWYTPANNYFGLALARAR